MNLEFRIWTALGALALAEAAMAAPAITVRRVPTGLTNVLFQQKLSPILEAQRQMQLLRTQQLNAQLKSALSASEPERKALSDALAKDPRYKSLLEQATRLGTAGGDAATRAAQLKALMGANRVIFEDAIRTAGIKQQPNLMFRLKPVNPTKTGALSGQSSGPAPSIPDLVLQPPYDFETHDTDNGGLAYSAATPTSDLGRGTAQMESGVVGVAGSAGGYVEIGNSISIPSGVRRVEITVSAKTSYSGSAFSALGISSAFADWYISVYPSDLVNPLVQEDDYDSVFAPIGWYSDMSGGETRDHVLTASIPAGVSSLVVLSRVDASCIGTGVPGYAESQSKVEISKIRVHFLTD